MPGAAPMGQPYNPNAPVHATEHEMQFVWRPAEARPGPRPGRVRVLRRRDHDGRRRRGPGVPEALHARQQALERVGPRCGREVAQQGGLPPESRGDFEPRSGDVAVRPVLDRPDLRRRGLPGDEERRRGRGRRHDGPRRHGRKEGRRRGPVRPDDGRGRRGVEEPAAAQRPIAAASRPRSGPDPDAVQHPDRRGPRIHEVPTRRRLPVPRSRSTSARRAASR